MTGRAGLGEPRAKPLARRLASKPPRQPGETIRVAPSPPRHGAARGARRGEAAAGCLAQAATVPCQAGAAVPCPALCLTHNDDRAGPPFRAGIARVTDVLTERRVECATVSWPIAQQPHRRGMAATPSSAKQAA